jgi:hypothetical protein
MPHLENTIQRLLNWYDPVLIHSVAKSDLCLVETAHNGLFMPPRIRTYCSSFRFREFAKGSRCRRRGNSECSWRSRYWRAQDFADDVAANHSSGRYVQALPSRDIRSLGIIPEIRLAIRCGRIQDAEALIKKYFPSVINLLPQPPLSRLGEPGSAMAYVPQTSVDTHDIVMNLKIQQFIEDCRTVPLPFHPSNEEPSLPESSTSGSAPQNPENPTEAAEKQTALLKAAQKLYAFALVVPDPEHKAAFLKTLAHVAGLLAYKVPEESPIKEYFSQVRRDAVAQQVVTAILCKHISTISFAMRRANGLDR